jgi:tRNA-dihydrouridine synthase B
LTYLARTLAIGPLVVDPPLLEAPMAGFSNHAYRQLLRQLGGVGLPVTEMLSARGLLYAVRRGTIPIFGRGHRRQIVGAALARKGDCPRCSPERLWGVAEEPRPLAVQIWDNDPQTLAAIGTRLVQDYGVSVMDINFGCPVRDISEKAQSGSYLLRYPERIGQIVAATAAACAPAPVTAKIRLGATRDTINAIDVAQAVEDAGGAAVTVHGRTAAEGFRGAADWDEIARVKLSLRRIPVVGNGDLTTPQAVVEAMRRYGVDGVMIGRAALGRPWLFRQAAAALRGQPIPPDPAPAEICQLVLEHFRLLIAQFGDDGATVLMRKYACCYSRGHPGGRAFRAAISRINSPEELCTAVGQLWHQSPLPPGAGHGEGDLPTR